MQQTICHYGIIDVVSDGHIVLYAAGRSRDPYARGYPQDIYLIIGPDSIDPITPPTIDVDGPLADLIPHPTYPEPTVIQLPWDDFAPPAVPPAWWTALAKAIERVAAKVDSFGILAYCQGGHGRTGTTLSILAYLLGLVDAETVEHLVTYLRARYCDQAVESHDQWDYIAAATGLPAGRYQPPYRPKAASADTSTTTRRLPSGGLVEW